MSTSDHNFIQFIEETAREAGELLLSYFGKVAIEYKAEVDVVTEADRKSEKLIIERLKSRWPAHDITAEESARKYKTLDTEHRHPDICLLLGEILTRKQDYAGALQEMRDFLAISPGAANAEEVKAKAKTLEEISLAKQQ